MNHPRLLFHCVLCYNLFCEQNSSDSVCSCLQYEFDEKMRRICHIVNVFVCRLCSIARVKCETYLSSVKRVLAVSNAFFIVRMYVCMYVRTCFDLSSRCNWVWLEVVIVFF
jgi:hypothetical protein